MRLLRARRSQRFGKHVQPATGSWGQIRPRPQPRHPARVLATRPQRPSAGSLTHVPPTRSANIAPSWFLRVPVDARSARRRVARRTQPAAAQDARQPPRLEIPNEKCFNCHDDAETEERRRRSIAVLARGSAPARTSESTASSATPTPLTIKHPRNNARPGDVRRLHGVPRGRDHALPRQRACQGARATSRPACQGCHGSVHTTPRSRDPQRTDVRG